MRTQRDPKLIADLARINVGVDRGEISLQLADTLAAETRHRFLEREEARIIAEVIR